ncbi:MAG: 2-oxo acid dehydrogenase subunit E2 [Dehalococcoidia bacterium]|nr:2-oxo acid dehydrogenase subunit E2 [Dehalococcoidia bacterium]MYA52080.1 2-oxo acid dehydrogenase subunit E2 [Dehalococcoidia bacterium]
MATITMPQLGESVTEGTVLQWLKQPGDTVALDEPICEIETEKVTAELPSPFEGALGEILVPEGETVEVDAPLCTILETAASAPEPAPGPAAAPEPASVAAEAPAPGVDGSRAGVYSPVVQRLAAKHEIDLTAIAGSGRGGRVTRKDVQAIIDEREREAAAADGIPPAAAPLPLPEGEVVPTPEIATVAASDAYDVVPLSATRRKIGENMVRSTTEAPQAWMMVEADVTGLVDLRARERERFVGVDLTYLPYFASTVAHTLTDFPELNARWHGDELRRYRRVNLGIAIATERGLVVPVVPNARDLSVAGLARRIDDLVTRAHAGKLRLEDIEEGTFTVNNTGAFGSIASKPIVNHPQVGIVTMERVVRRPIVVEGDAIAIRSMMNVALSFDHRALDGAEAGGFLAALKERLEALG